MTNRPVPFLFSPTALSATSTLSFMFFLVRSARLMHILQPDTHLVGGVRVGVRASGVGERPYLDPSSTGRREALGLPID